LMLRSTAGPIRWGQKARWEQGHEVRHTPFRHDRQCGYHCWQCCGRGAGRRRRRQR
jgi:hypothetical protein